jgi:hypothetical protein
MQKIQNDNITFRVTTDLKSRLTEFCLENDPQFRRPSPSLSQIP